MPKTLKTFLCLAALDVAVLCASCIGFMLHQETQAAEQTLALRQQPTQRWTAERLTESEPLGTPGSAAYEACARDVQADYSDDPVKAYWWVKTLCHH